MAGPGTASVAAPPQAPRTRHEAEAPADGEAGASRGTRIQSVARASRLLMLVASLPESERTMSRLAVELALTIPTTYHLVNTLVDARLLTRDEKKHIHLGASVGALATAYTEQSVVPVELLRPLHKIVKQTGESAYLSAWQDRNIVMLTHLVGTHAVQVWKLQPGYRGVAHARASGKVLLAFAKEAEREAYLALNPLTKMTGNTISTREQLNRELAQVVRQGYATEEEEFSPGVACIAVPVWDTGLLVGAFALSTPVERYCRSKQEYLSCLRECAAEIGA